MKLGASTELNSNFSYTENRKVFMLNLVSEGKFVFQVLRTLALFSLYEDYTLEQATDTCKCFKAWRE